MPENCHLSESYVLALATVYNGPAPGANTNIFAPVTPGARAAKLRLTIALTTSSKVDIRVTDGTNAFSITLNGDAAIPANTMYMEEFGARKFSSQDGSTPLTYSVRVKTDSVIQVLFFDEIGGPT